LLPKIHKYLAKVISWLLEAPAIADAQNQNSHPSH